MQLNYNKAVNTNQQSNNETSYDQSLHDWLEHDLEQHAKNNDNENSASSLSKCSLKHIISQENHSPLLKNKPDIKTTQMQLQSNQQPTNGQIPVIKVYSLLNSIRQNEQIVKDIHYHNKKRIYAIPTLSLSNGNVKKRKRGNNRPPIDVSVKRQRNTDAARRSRLKKALKMETLETRVDSLSSENGRLRVKVAVLETEVSHVAEKEARNRQRVLDLEAQLSLVHKQLVEPLKG